MTLEPTSQLPSQDAVVTVMHGAVGAHVGILYVADDTPTSWRHLHLAWHCTLRDDDDSPTDAFWVEPGLGRYETSDLRASARLIARRHRDGRVPYAFQVGEARFSPDGILELNGFRGLTCATFVLLVFQHARVDLLDRRTWDTGRSPQRREEDNDAQERLVEYLRTTGSGEHAAAVAEEVGCTRIRAEEVAAASGMSSRPVQFADAEREGGKVLFAISQARARDAAAEVKEGVDASD